MQLELPIILALSIPLGACSLIVDADRFGGDETSDARASSDGNGGGDGSPGGGDAGPVGDGSTADARMVDRANACIGYPPLLFEQTKFVESTGPLILDMAGTYQLDTSGAGSLTDPTDTSVPGVNFEIMTQTGEYDYMLLLVDWFEITNDQTVLRVTGDRPLYIASVSTIHIMGPIDASSNSADGLRGAGADRAQACGTGTGSPGSATDGGGGGGFGGIGGDGGGGVQGGGSDDLNPFVLRGGCAGGDGSSTPAPAGGRGGGAILLLACESIDLQGGLDAYGQGGRGATAAGGGAGGGSGGFVGVYTPELMLPEATTLDDISRVGGGSGGGGGTDLASGEAGPDGDVSAPSGGSGGGLNAGAGGAGGQWDSPFPGQDEHGKDGADGLGGLGGGGGGGAGLVRDPTQLMQFVP